MWNLSKELNAMYSLFSFDILVNKFIGWLDKWGIYIRLRTYLVGLIDGSKLVYGFSLIGRVSIRMPFLDKMFVSFANICEGCRFWDSKNAIIFCGRNRRLGRFSHVTHNFYKFPITSWKLWRERKELKERFCENECR